MWTWSLGGLVVVAGLLDATVLKRDPVADTANVELREEPGRTEILVDPEPDRRIAAPLEQVERLSEGVPAWLPATTTAETKIPIEIEQVELTHGSAAKGMDVELRSECKGAVARFRGSTVKRTLPASATLVDGRYDVVAICPGTGEVLEARIAVGPR